MTARLLLLHCLSPLHAGTGQGMDVVDLSIARERATGFPYLPGSSLKGSLRARSHHAGHPQKTRVMFGPPTVDASDHAGALAFGDANLLFLPVRSVRGTFAYVTSPYLLQRFGRDLAQAGVPALPTVAPLANNGTVAVHSATMLKDRASGNVYFEDFDFVSAAPCDALVEALAELVFEDESLRTQFTRRFCLVHDDIMSFLARHATDVVTRVALDAETKTVKKGQLWTEENLPSESILSTLIVSLAHGASKHGGANMLFNDLQTLIDDELLLGGKSTVGRGRCKARLVGGEQ